MKKGILILMVLFATSTYSQNFGFHFGTNLSTQTNKDKLRNNSKENDFQNVFGINNLKELQDLITKIKYQIIYTLQRD